MGDVKVPRKILGNQTESKTISGLEMNPSILEIIYGFAI